MKEKPSERIEKHRVRFGKYGSDASYGNNGLFKFRIKSGAKLTVMISDGGGWDHVSISLKDRCPTWDEMNLIKDIFFEDHETVVQFHPKKEQYVNDHPYTLHLWKKQGVEHELPPIIFV